MTQNTVHVYHNVTDIFIITVLRSNNVSFFKNLLRLKRQSHQRPGLSRTVPDRPGPSRTEILPILGPIRVGSGVIRDSPGWSGMVRHGPGHHHEGLKMFKIAGSSVTVRDDCLVRGSPGRSVYRPCWLREGP